jgi:hypothetical protein
MGSLWTTNGYSLGYHPRGTTLVYWICSLRFPIWGMNHLGKGSLYNCYVWLCLKLGYPKWWSITKFPAQIAMFRDRIFSDRSIPCFKRNYIKLLDQIWWIITYPFLSAYSAYSHVLLFQKHSSKIAQTGKKTSPAHHHKKSTALGTSKTSSSSSGVLQTTTAISRPLRQKFRSVPRVGSKHVMKKCGFWSPNMELQSNKITGFLTIK